MFFKGLITSMAVLLTIGRSYTASDSCPASSDVSYGSSCYYYHSESKTWDMAQKACEAEGGVLTSLNSETEVSNVLGGIRDMAKRESVADYWIGLTNQDGGEYRWCDDTLLNNKKIEGKIKVVAGGRGCVSAESGDPNWNSGNVLYLRNCSLSYAYVCEVNSTAAVWSPWGSWSKCSATCGFGIRTRSRNCTSGSRWSTTRCSGTSSEQEQCQAPDCPASDSTWSTWTAWSACSVTCGQGQKSRSRSCGNSTLDNQSCPGNNNETTNCQIQSCPEWSDWGSWGSCSETCGEGERTRQRSCTTGDNKDCSGTQEDKEACNLGQCSGHVTAGRWAEWSPWTSCSSTCGKGNRTRTRSCVQEDGTPSSGCNGPQSSVVTCVPQCPGLSKAEFVQAIQSDLDDETTRKAMAWAKETSKRRENVFNTKGVRDYRITGHVIQTFAVSSKVRCAMKCLSFDSCGSFNYEYNSNGNGLHTCQINSASSEVAKANLQKQPGYIFYDYSMFTPFEVNGN